MDYISEIFERLDIQCVREFLLHGCNVTDINSKSYIERLKIPEKIMSSMLHGEFPDEKEYEKVTEKIYNFATACQDVYMEIGLQCGSVLAMQIVTNTKAP